MISSIQSPAVTKTATPAAPPAPAPAPPPATTQFPTDEVNFNALDTPAAAAAMPVLDPAVQANIVLGALMPAMAQTPLAAYIDVSIVTGTNGQMPPNGPGADPGQIGENIIVDPGNQQRPIVESGIVGQKFTYNSVTADAQGNPSLQGNVENLAITSGTDKSLHLDGTIGTVEAHVVLSKIDQPDPQKANLFFGGGIHAEGTLGGQKYVSDTTFGEGSEPNTMAINVKGKLGEADITKTYSMKVSQDGSGNLKGVTAQTTGQGIVAGVPEQVTVNMRFGESVGKPA